MNQYIAHIALVVEDYDPAIDFYTRKLNFDLIEDTKLSETKRWVLVAPKGSKECKIVFTYRQFRQRLPKFNQSKYQNI
jgi:catechol 2,3-dioxygenase-like lactoylglutathione lyase family enzyme